MISILIKGGADVDTKADNGQTRLFAAAAYGHGKVIQLLLMAGADSAIYDLNGEIAYTLASRSCQEGAAPSLLLAMKRDRYKSQNLRAQTFQLQTSL